MDFTTSATTNLHVNSRRKPKFNVNVVVPYVAIPVLFAAESSYADFMRGFGSRARGNTHRSASMSMRIFFPVVLSVMNKRCNVAVRLIGQVSTAVVNDYLHGLSHRLDLSPKRQ